MLERCVLIVQASTSARETTQRVLAVVRSVPDDVEVVHTGPRLPKLSEAVRRRVRRSAGTLQEVQARIPTGVRALVLSADVPVSHGWWQDVSSTGAVVAENRVAAVFLHHRSLSAVLIVRDEEAVLAECLCAVRPFVDEIVVYDTGSIDSTVAVAEAAGARVVRGYWDDDFGAARSRALPHYPPDWVFSLDADEIVGGDPGRFRAAVDGCRQESMAVDISSRTWAGAASATTSGALRLFQRIGSTWVGRLHEHPIRTDSQRLTVAVERAPLHVDHSGYEAATFLAKGKHERNIAIARAALQAAKDGDPEEPQVRINLVRALTADSRFAEALEVLNAGSVASASRDQLLLGARSAVQCALQTGAADEAELWAERARSAGESVGQIVFWRAEVSLLRGEVQAAEAELTHVVPSDDPWGIPFDTSAVAGLRLRIAQRGGGDVRGLLAQAWASASQQITFSELLLSEKAAPGVLQDAASAAPDAFVLGSLRDAAAAAPQAADAWLEALFDTGRHRGHVLVCASVVARRLPLHRLLTWSVRVRSHGFTDRCPLTWVAREQPSGSTDQLVALAVLGGVLEEQWALDGLLAHRSRIEPAVLAHLDSLVPGLGDTLASLATVTA